MIGPLKGMPPGLTWEMFVEIQKKYWEEMGVDREVWRDGRGNREVRGLGGYLGWDMGRVRALLGLRLGRCIGKMRRKGRVEGRGIERESWLLVRV
jgi:hypothetical protein